jgi:hypothetical protein
MPNPILIRLEIGMVDHNIKSVFGVTNLKKSFYLVHFPSKGLKYVIPIDFPPLCSFVSSVVKKAS